MNSKHKQLRKHRILGIPVLGLIIGGVFTFIICHFVGGLFGMPIDFLSTGLPLETLSAKARDAAFLNQLPQTCYYFMTALMAFLMIFIHKKWFQGEFKGCCSGKLGDKKTRLLILAGILVTLALLIYSAFVVGIKMPTVEILCEALMAGLCEEVAFRLVPLSFAMRKGVTKKNIYTALIATSVLFGVVHFSNLAGGQDIVYTIIQALFAIAGGVFFGGIYLRTGNLLITIIFHTVYDFLVFLLPAKSGNIWTDYVLVFALAVVYIVLGLNMLKGNTDDMEEVWSDRWNYQAA